MPTSPPTTERGVSNPSGGVRLPGFGSMAGALDEIERTPRMRWPLFNRETAPAMRNDSQIEALYYATTLPIRRYRWMLDPNGADPIIVERLSADLGLPVKGAPEAPVPRARNRFSFGDHLRLVLEALIEGHYFFEQVAPIGDDGFAQLRKLAPRAPHTIDEIKTAADGGLVSIRQTIGGGTGTSPPDLSVDRLVAYVWDQSPGRWVGRSMLRSLYREWRMKDELLRIDVLKHRRNGMGVPVARATVADVSPAQLRAAQEIAAAWEVGEHASTTLPYGVDIDLKGVTGTLPDTLASIQRHDEAMSRRWLGMLIQLGQTETGSRALGSEFSDLIELGRDAIASWVCDVFTDHVIEDYVDWNWEGREFVPRLTYERDLDGEQVAAPPATEPPMQERPLGAPAIPPPPAATKRNLYAAARTALTEPQPRRRELFDHEILAATDFDAMDAGWRSTLEGLLTEWEAVTAAEIGELADRVAAASSLDDLATVQVSPAGAVVLAEAMRQTARDGAAAARAEAGAQGISAPEPDLDPVNEVLDARAGATATLLARSISEAGGRHALTLAGGALSNEAVAEGVRDHLEGLSTAYLEQRLGGAVTSAQNYGRSAAFREAETITGGASYYASELLDNATCEPCEEIDGHQFESLEDAEANYPTGAFVHCEGGERCRGAVVAVYEESG